jgi:hypothetical protein
VYESECLCVVTSAILAAVEWNLLQLFVCLFVTVRNLTLLDRDLHPRVQVAEDSCTEVVESLNAAVTQFSNGMFSDCENPASTPSTTVTTTPTSTATSTPMQGLVGCGDSGAVLMFATESARTCQST